MRPWHAYQGLVIFIKNLSKLGPMLPYGTGSSGQDTVWAGTFWGVLNVSLRAFGTQLILDLTCFVIRHPSSIVHHSPSVIRHLSSAVRRPSSTFRHPTFFICRLSSVIHHLSFVIRHPPSFIRHLSLVGCHRSSVIRALLYFFCIFSPLFPYFFSFSLYFLQK